MSWSYRVIRVQSSRLDYYYRIHEVFYDKDGNINGWTENPVKMEHESIDSVSWVLEKMKDALDSPILEEKDGKLTEVNLR